MLRAEQFLINFIDFGFTRPGLEPTIYRTRGEYINDYTTYWFVFGEHGAPCLDIKGHYSVDFEKELQLQKSKYVFPPQLSILFQWQSKEVATAQLSETYLISV